MRFLKKASYKDIIGEIEGSQFHYYEDVSSKYKELELYLTKADLDDLHNNKEQCRDKLIEKLKSNGAVISAIHCPESTCRTCNEADNEPSANYLSLCEILRKQDALNDFKHVLEFANKVCAGQYEKNLQESAGDEDDFEDDINVGNKKEDKSIIVVIHEGCEKGCIVGDNVDAELCTTWNCNHVVDAVEKLIEDIEINCTIQIALENITPFYSVTECDISKGGNCGWKKENQKSKKDFFEYINKKLKDKKIQFGACIDFCHIMVSDAIMGENTTKSESIHNYFEQIDYKEYIFLFHVSNYGNDWSHGQLFSLENEADKNALDAIRKKCYEKKDAPVTFEMADGTDVEKAALNYEHIMFYFSNKHLFGRFSELLENEKNKELKQFFDALFLVYSYDKKNVFEITNALWIVKNFILKNTFVKDKKERLFGVDFDKTDMKLSLVRLKAYVYYTRFCNLGNFLADNYYSGDTCIWPDPDAEQVAIDFGLAMKYFMFNDKIHQCVYTGIQFKFLIDFLPKKENFVRFNDGITEPREITIGEGNIDEKNIFNQVTGKIKGHINGVSVKNGEPDFYSVGKDFGQCLFKYFDSSRPNWSLQIYKNQPINYVDYNKTRYSIQAFTQFVLQGGVKAGNTLGLSLDISKFASGRDGKAEDSLEGFLKSYNSNNGLGKETVASISDGEILFTELPPSSEKYTLSKEQGVILKKVFLEMKEKKNISFPCKLSYDENAAQKDTQEMITEIESANKNPDYEVWKILDTIRTIYDLSKIDKQKLEVLNPYSGNDKNLYEEHKNYIHCKWKEDENGQCK